VWVEMIHHRMQKDIEMELQPTLTDNQAASVHKPRLDMAQMRLRSKTKLNTADVISTAQVAWCTKCLGVKTEEGQTPLQSVASASSLKIMWIGAAIVLGLIGSFLCFFGYSKHIVTMGTVGSLAFFIIGFLLTCGLIGGSYTGLGATIISAMIGLTLAMVGCVVFVMFETASFILVGAVGGLVLALELNALVLHFLYDAIGGTTGSYVALGVNVFVALLGGILAVFQHTRRPLLIFSTAFGGAYLLGWSVLQLIVGADKESSVAAQMNPLVLFGAEKWNGDVLSYVAMVGFIVLGALGALIQFKWTAQNHAGKDNEAEHCICGETPCVCTESGAYTEPLTGDDHKGWF